MSSSAPVISVPSIKGIPFRVTVWPATDISSDWGRWVERMSGIESHLSSSTPSLFPSTWPTCSLLKTETEFGDAKRT